MRRTVYWSKAITAGSETSGCTLVSNLSTASLRWAAVRKNHVDPAHNEEACRSYATNFFEARTARHAASFCKDGLLTTRDTVQPVMSCRRFIKQKPFRDQGFPDAVEADLARNRARRPAAPFLSVGLAPPTKSEFRTTNA